MKTDLHTHKDLAFSWHKNCCHENISSVESLPMVTETKWRFRKTKSSSRTKHILRSVVILKLKLPYLEKGTSLRDPREPSTKSHYFMYIVVRYLSKMMLLELSTLRIPPDIVSWSEFFLIRTGKYWSWRHGVLIRYG